MRHLKADGTDTALAPANGEKFTLEELQAAVGGFIEVLLLDTGELMIVNEHAKLEHAGVNQAATRLARQHAGIAAWDYIVGDVVIADVATVE